MAKFAKEDATALRIYFDDISRSDPLPREKELALAQRISEGDTEARNELVQANLRFVVEVAKQYQNRGLALADLISAGNLGLVMAAERFDGSKGFKFISYAVWWIKQAILQAIDNQGRTVRLPLNKLGLLRAITKASERLVKEQQNEPDVDAIAAELDVTPQQVTRALISARTMHSLDEEYEGDEKTPLHEILVDNEQLPPDAELMRQSEFKYLGRMLDSLEERERQILQLYFGLNGSKGHTLEEIGDALSLTRERVRQLKERALNKLRYNSKRTRRLA